MLYGYKWTSINGEEFDERSHAGQVWINKTKDLSTDQWFRAVDRCEKEVRIRTRSGDEAWPPSYEEFLAYATEYTNRAHKPFAPSLPEPKELREKRKARGRQECRKILSIFND